MAYENITLRKRNMTMVDGYFYMVDEQQDSLIVKTDDGTQAFTYPLDTVIGNQITSLEHDGHNFWTLENLASDNIRIRRWNIENYVLKLRTTFSINSTGTDKYESNAFTVQHYHPRFSGNEAAGQSNLSVTTDGNFDLASELSSGMTVYLGPNSNGQSEEASVNSAGADFININGTTSYAYNTGDPISFYSNIWVFNDYYGLNNTGGLYKFNGYAPGGAPIAKYSGGAYKDVEAATFWDASETFGAGSNAIAYVKTTNLIFLDPNDLTDSFGSMTMDNLEDDQATVIPIYDISFSGLPYGVTITGTIGQNIYRLQRKATYYGTTYTFADSTYNYQLSTMDPFITSISLRSNPAILPANGVNVAQITAVVKDQFNQPIVGKLVYFTEDDPQGVITTNPVATDGDGEAVTAYRAGTSAREVKITATAQQG